jgi:serine/threonine-protein kinase RsbW
MEVPCEPPSLPFVRLALRHLSQDAGFKGTDLGKIEAAVSEACSNILEHGCAHLKEKPPIELTVSKEGMRFIISIVDAGKAFDIEGHDAPVFPDHWHGGHTRGAGIYLIQRCVDEVSYHQIERGRNELRLVKLFA